MFITLTHTSGAKWRINLASIARYTAVVSEQDIKVKSCVLFSSLAGEPTTHYFHETPERIDKLVDKATGR